MERVRVHMHIHDSTPMHVIVIVHIWRDTFDVLLGLEVMQRNVGGGLKTLVSTAQPLED